MSPLIISQFDLIVVSHVKKAWMRTHTQQFLLIGFEMYRIILIVKIQSKKWQRYTLNYAAGLYC